MIVSEQDATEPFHHLMTKQFLSAVSPRLGLFFALAILSIHISAGMAAPPAALDGQGRLMLGDKPFFPVGLYEVAIPEIRSVPRESFNVVADPYWAQGPQTTPEYLKAAGEGGSFLIAGLPFEQVRAKDDRFIERYVRAVKGDEHLLVWYAFEEPSGSHVTVEQGEFACQAIHKQDPARPILFVDFQTKNVTAYRNCYDIFAYDFYPIGTSSIVYWRNMLKGVVQAAHPKPVWGVIQAFGHADPKHDWVPPTPEEIRCMAYLAVIEGCQGILFYSHGRRGDPFYVREHPEHWAFMQRLGAELQALSPVLLSPVVDGGASVGNKSIDLILRRRVVAGNPPTAEMYLVAANMAHKTPAVERHYPGVRQADVRIVLKDVGDGQAEVVGSAGTGSAKAGRIVPIHGGAFVDSFDPYCVHVYRIISETRSHDR